MAACHFEMSLAPGLRQQTILARRACSAVQKFADGAPGLIDGDIRVRAGAGIGICDGNLAERFPADDPGLLLLFPSGIEQRIRRKGIAMRPAIHRDAFDVLRRVETSSTEHAAQLVPDVSLEFRKRRLQQFGASGAVLVPLRKSGFAGSTQHEENRRLLRIARKAVLTKT